MRAFAHLLDRLSLTSSRNAKLRLVRDYLGAAPDPERGFALAALTGGLSFDAAKPAMIRKAVEARTDPVLFGWSYNYVGDLAEAVALVWPRRPGSNQPEPTLPEVVEALRSVRRNDTPALLEGWLDALEPRERWALLKLITRELRVGLSSRLAKQSLADLAERYGHSVEVAEVEEVWHALEPPYAELFAWIEGRGPRPDRAAPGRFRPAMLAQAVDEGVDFARLEPAAYAAEWKWDGIRVQAVREGGEARLYTRTGDEVSKSFPDLMEQLDFEGVLDGELLVMRDGRVAPFGDLQQRLNRKTVDARLMAAHPVSIRAYDILSDAGQDTRGLSFAERRARLERLVAGAGGARLDLSPLVAFDSWEALASIRASPPEGDPQSRDAAAAEGLMLKRWDSVYEAGRPKGPWFKWKRDPYLVDAVLMYAQRGHGRRSSFYSDFTFGVWQEGALTPVGKAYFGFTDEELKQLDKFVRDHTTERFGPVRSVRADRGFGLVFEVAFEGLQRSTRHKSGVAMRFPRINRIRWDKPAAEADTMEVLEAMLQKIEAGRTPG